MLIVSFPIASLYPHDFHPSSPNILCFCLSSFLLLAHCLSIFLILIINPRLLSHLKAQLHYITVDTFHPIFLNWPYFCKCPTVFTSVSSMSTAAAKNFKKWNQKMSLCCTMTLLSSKNVFTLKVENWNWSSQRQKYQSTHTFLFPHQAALFFARAIFIITTPSFSALCFPASAYQAHPAPMCISSPNTTASLPVAFLTPIISQDLSLAGFFHLRALFCSCAPR